MSEYLRQPENKNFLSPLGFKFQVNKLPDTNFFVQSVTLPGIDVGFIEVSNPFAKIPTVGDQLTFGDLLVTFRVNETMSNYIEVFNWMVGIGFPSDFEQRAAIQRKPTGSGLGLYSDAVLTILSSAMNPNIEIKIVDAFPVSLSAITMDSTLEDVQYIEATATFKFLEYTITPL